MPAPDRGMAPLPAFYVPAEQKELALRMADERGVRFADVAREIWAAGLARVQEREKEST